MTNLDLVNIILNDNNRIAQAITTGAAWEIWMQVELIILLRDAGKQAAREVPYPHPNQAWHLDATAQDAAGSYAIELKVESANNAGVALLNAALADAAKIANYPPQAPGARWVVAIGYSAVAKHALSNYAAVAANASIFQTIAGNNIGVMIKTV